MQNINSKELMKSIKILYAEDEKEARDELVDVLKRRAGKVYVADNGKKAWSMFEDYDPDIVITDIYMPEMNGLELLRKIKESGKSPAVVVISAINDVETILGAVDTGIQKYVLKPIDLKELLEVLLEISAEIISKRKYLTAVLPENRRQLEDELKKQFAAFFKSYTGKGPRDINVFIGEGQIEIIASEVMTTLEKSIRINGKNDGVVKYVREVFFSSNESVLNSLVSEVTGRQVTLNEIRINVEKDRNKLIFTDIG